MTIRVVGCALICAVSSCGPDPTSETLPQASGPEQVAGNNLTGGYVPSVLFIGNSLIATETLATHEDMPAVLLRLASARGEKLTVQRALTPGYTLQQTWNAGTAQPFLATAAQWDFVVLQEYSTLPVQNPNAFYQTALSTYQPSVRRSLKPDTGRVILFENWALADPYPFSNRADYTAALDKNYDSLSSQLTTPNLIAPLSKAFEIAFAAHPLSYLLADGKHPNDAGVYLNACVFHAILFHESPIGLPSLYLPAAQAAYLQNVASQVLGFATAVVSVTLEQTSVAGAPGPGRHSTGMVTLNGLAPSAPPVTVTLSSSNPSVLRVDNVVQVSPGAASVPFGMSAMTVPIATSVTVSASFNGSTKSATLTVTNISPIGWVDLVADAAGSSVVRPNDNMIASGWAADWEDGSTPTRVTVSLDGKIAGTATASTPRPDVAAYFSNPAFANTGWSLELSTSGLTLGSHTMTAIASDSAGATAPLSGSATFTISDANQPPIGWVDNVRNAAGSSTVRPNEKVVASGWAGDWEDGPTPSRVTVSLDGKVAETTTASTPRPDVAAYFGNPAFTNTGWSAALDINGLSIGNHTVTAVATDSAGATAPLSGSVNFTISDANQPPIGWTDLGTNAAGSSTVHRNDAVVAIGWAADWEDGTTPTRVTVSVDGNNVGTTTASAARSDVAAYFGNPSFANSGWSLQLNLSGLSLGSHAVTAMGTDSAGATAPLSGSVSFSLVN